MCNQFNRKFRKIFENHAWQSYYKEFCVEYSVCPEMGEQLYILQNGVSNDLRGTYVNPLLINYIAIWASPKYAVKVGIIMDALDEKNQLTNQTLEDTIKQLQSELNELRIKNQQQAEVITEHESTIEVQAEVITEQTSTIEEQKIDIFENHNRVNEYNNNFLYIVSDPEDKECFKISVN